MRQTAYIILTKLNYIRCFSLNVNFVSFFVDFQHFSGLTF